MISGPFYLIMAFFLPETSAPTILYYEAKRRREETGKKDLVSEAELKQRDLHVGSLLWDALVKPWVLNAKDPALGFTTLYLGLTYGIFYSFFEVSFIPPIFRVLERVLTKYDSPFPWCTLPILVSAVLLRV